MVYVNTLVTHKSPIFPRRSSEEARMHCDQCNPFWCWAPLEWIRACQLRHTTEL